MPHPSEEGVATGIQHAFWYHQQAEATKEDSSRLAFSQAFHENATSANERTGLQSLSLSAFPKLPQVASCYHSGRRSSKLIEISQDTDSDSCDFNEIDHEIQDTLHRSGSAHLGVDGSFIGSESQLEDSTQSEKIHNNSSLNNSLVEPMAINSADISADGSSSAAQEDCGSSSCSGASSAAEATVASWCVIVPSEAVLFFDNLD